MHRIAMLENRRTNSIIRRKVTGWLAPYRTVLESLVLLMIRLYWGWEFFLTGRGKLSDFGKADTIFSKPWNSLSTPASDSGRRHRMRRWPVPLVWTRRAPCLHSANDPAHGRVSHSRYRQIQHDIQRPGQILGRRRISISFCGGVGLCLWARKILPLLAVYAKAGIAENQKTYSRWS